MKAKEIKQELDTLSRVVGDYHFARINQAKVLLLQKPSPPILAIIEHMIQEIKKIYGIEK